jgi:hypothetical protein
VKSHEQKAATGTYEERIGRISAAITAYYQRSDPLGGELVDDDELGVYAYTVETYPDRAIAGVYDAGVYAYYSFPYTVDADGGIVLGEPTEVEQTYQPVKGLTIAAHGHGALIAARTFVDRIKALAAVRTKQGRVLSASNRQRLADLRARLQETETALADLLAETEPHDAAEAEKGRTTALQEMLRFEAMRAARFVGAA